MRVRCIFWFTHCVTANGVGASGSSQVGDKIELLLTKLHVNIPNVGNFLAW